MTQIFIITRKVIKLKKITLVLENKVLISVSKRPLKIERFPVKQLAYTAKF